MFREILDSLVVLETPLKTETDIDSEVERLTKIIQTAAWQATPDRNENCLKETCPIIVKQQIAEKRKARKRWQHTRSDSDRKIFNKKAKDLKNLLHHLKNEHIQAHLNFQTLLDSPLMSYPSGSSIYLYRFM